MAAQRSACVLPSRGIGRVLSRPGRSSGPLVGAMPVILAPRCRGSWRSHWVLPIAGARPGRPRTRCRPSELRWPVSYTHLRAHETPEHLVCRLLLDKKKKYYTRDTTDSDT